MVVDLANSRIESPRGSPSPAALIPCLGCRKEEGVSSGLLAKFEICPFFAGVCEGGKEANVGCGLDRLRAGAAPRALLGENEGH